MNQCLSLWVANEAQCLGLLREVFAAQLSKLGGRASFVATKPSHQSNPHFSFALSHCITDDCGIFHSAFRFANSANAPSRQHGESQSRPRHNLTLPPHFLSSTYTPTALPNSLICRAFENFSF